MALNWPWFEPGMAYLGGNGVDFPLRQAYCFLCGFHLHDIEQMLHPDREDEWNPSVVGGRDPWPLQWLKDLAYVTIHPDRTCNYNIYKRCFCPCHCTS